MISARPTQPAASSSARLPSFTLGDMIRQLRVERGITQSQLARTLGLRGNGYLSRVESGAVLPSAAMQARLAAALGVEQALLSARAAREAHGATATALLSDMARAFDEARAHFADELRALSSTLAQHQARIAHTLRLSELQLLWGLPDKVAYEAGVSSAWVLSPDLLLDASAAELQAVVVDNLARGVEYRYLVPDQRAVVRRARQLVAQAPAGAHLEIRLLPGEDPLLISEVVLYDARTDRRLGLMVAPTDRPDVDCVLSATHSFRLVRAFERAWRGARPLTRLTRAKHGSSPR